MRGAAVVLAIASTVAGCTGRKAEPAGIGPWRFTTTTRKDATTGVCSPTTLTDGRTATWCYGFAAPQISGRTVELHTYFEGTEPSGRLIEIQLKVRGCVEQDVDEFMRRAYGTPVATKSTRTYWKNSYLWAVAMMPDEPGHCLVHILPLSEAAEIKRLEQL